MVARVKVVHASNDDVFDVPVRTPVRVIRGSLVDAFNIPETALSLVNGRQVSENYGLLDNDRLEFVIAWGQKASHDPPVPEQERLLTVKEAAAELRCSISFVYKLMLQGQISYECRGRRKLLHATSVADYRRRNTHPASPSASPKTRASTRQPYQFQRLFTDHRPRRGG